jgi:hypothetical protein
VLTSDAIRARIKAKLDAMRDPTPHMQQTQIGMMVAFFSPLRNLRNLVLGVKASDTLDLKLSGDLNNASEAQQCAHLIQTFIVPLIVKSFETTDPENKIQADDSLQADNVDHTLYFTLQVTEQDVQNWQQPES